MKTKIYTLLFAIVVSIGTIFADSVVIEGIYYVLNSSDKTATVTYKGQSSDNYSSSIISIPESVSYTGQSYNVTAIGYKAFSYCTNLKSITIPNSVTRIEEEAISRCPNLTSIIIPCGVTYIGVNAFYNCSSLTSINIPNSLTHIDRGAFSYCSSLTSINIPNGVTRIGNGAFTNCSSITSITIPENVAEIEGMIFNGCSNLTTIIWNAKNCAFIRPSEEDYLTTTTPFYYYKSNPYSSMYDVRYDMRSQITSIVFGDAVEYIPASLCWGMSITSVTIPNSVKSIGYKSFSECGNLTSINIPTGVTSIGQYAFSSCRNLSLLYCELGTPLSIDNTTFQNTSPTIYISSCAFAAFSVAPVWKDLAIAPVSVNLAVMNNTGGVVVENCGLMEIEAIPYIGYHFKRWQDGNKENPRKYTLSQSNRNFIAQFEINKYTITLNCDANQGSITGDKGKYNYDTDHTIEALPNYGYHFTQWSDGETENPREFTLVQDTTFIALFAPNKYTLTIQYDNTYGSVEGEQGSFDYLSEHEIQVNAKYGYHFTEWSDGVTDNPRTLILTKDTTITASFAPNKYQLELIADANMGTINGEQGSFDYLSEHEITAVPNTGYLFSGWSDGATENPRTITLTRDTSITALFEHNLHTVTLHCDENQGSVSKSGDTHHSGSCTITATPNYGYHFTQWTDGDINNPRTFIVTQDTTFTAEFAVDKNGTCGDELVLTWTYDDEAKELTISGEGALNSNYAFGVEAPISVEKVIFDEGVTSVGNSAFANYTTLEEIHLASTIKKIYEQAFYNCENLVNIYCYRDVPCVVYNNTFDGIDKFGCTLHVPGASIEMYKAATGWRDFYYVVALPEPTPTGIDQLENGKYENVKIVKDGQILILRGDNTYTLTGQEMK